ncbi:MAG: transglycosylase family protein, partial [Actinomycetota bacterium]
AAPTGAAFAKVGAPRDIKRKVKRVKRELVDIEPKLDALRRTVDDLRRASEGLAAETRAARAELAEAPAERGLLPDFRRLGALVRLQAARSQRNTVANRLLSTRQRTFFVLAERDEQIARIETLVQRSRREGSERLPNWSLDGSLITYSADWEAVSMCESSGRWFVNTGLFDGGLQFLPSTWIGFGGGELARYAHQATKKQQIAIAERVLAVQGPKAWPNCFRPLPFHF